MEQLVTSEFKLGIIGGGQLGKMLTLAASTWDVKTYILDQDKNCPASSSCTRFIKGDPRDFDDVYKFGQQVDMITYEMEAINIEALKKLKGEGKRIAPEPETLEIIQDKGLQKEFFETNAIPTSSFSLFENQAEVLAAIEAGTISYPFVQKVRKGGYDGRGVSVIQSEADHNKLFDSPSVVEDMVEIAKEVSVIAARNEDNEIKCFPVAEMEFNEQANLVELLICPSSIGPELEQEAEAIARKVVSTFNMTGLLAIELFLDKAGKLWVNEVAPRPHNSGHHSIESIITSQYEQLLRAIFNIPLGSTRLKMPSAMINLLGEPGFQGPVKYEGLNESMKVEGVKIHLYGKRITKPFRKMGHITILAPTIEDAKAKAEIVKQTLKVKSWNNQS
jgi:5-(carboxyamino)imidazole ribonucleotide synthase